jgi:tetratricopeptide (TPR) repeat protein
MEELKKHLDKWANKSPTDPEMFIGYFNYYINMARNEQIVLGGKNSPKGDTFFSITDPKTGENIGYMYNEVNYNPEYAEKAMQTINEGISIAPNRLDMHFGKTRFLAELHAYDKQRDYIIKIFDQGNIIQNEWLWSDSKKVEDSENFFINAIHDYISEWFNSDNKTAYESIKTISELLIKYFPQNTIGYNDLGLYYAQKGDLENAKMQFLNAYDVNHMDYIVIGNLAYLYSVQKNKEEAIKYYTLMAQSDNIEYAEYAKKQLDKLKK